MLDTLVREILRTVKRICGTGHGVIIMPLPEGYIRDVYCPVCGHTRTLKRLPNSAVIEYECSYRQCPSRTGTWPTPGGNAHGAIRPH